MIGLLSVDETPETPAQFNVRGVSTILIFKKGELREKIVGAQTKQELRDKIDALL